MGPAVVRSEHGFTLVELLWTLAILGILSSISISMYEMYRDRAETSRALVTLHNTRTALEAGIDYLDSSETIIETSGQHGEPLSGDLARALPGMSVSDGVMVNVDLTPCADTSATTHQEVLTVYACNTDSYVWFLKTCAGIEVSKNYPSPAPGVC